MNVRLISCPSSKDAIDLLIRTKNTRLTMGEGVDKYIEGLTEEQKLLQIAYMSGTIPSSWEFVNYAFEITGVSRAFTHQFVRTRTGSFAQQTMRMLEMERFTYVTGPTIEKDVKLRVVYENAMRRIQEAYDYLISQGAAVEDARGLLPTNICTNIIAQFNLRSLADLSKHRAGKRTQGEYRDVLNAMQACVIEAHPWAKDFLFPDLQRVIASLEIYLANASAGQPFVEAERVAAFKLLDKLRSNL